MRNKITLLLLTQKGYEVLVALIADVPDVIHSVVSAADPTVVKDFYDDIKKLCDHNGIPFSNRTELRTIDTEYAMAISWRWLIDTRSTSLIVLHDSLLPKYRGFNSLVSALINGDDRIGVTAFYADDEYDRGDVIAQAETPVTYPMPIQKAIELVTENYKELAVRIAKAVVNGDRPSSYKQDEKQATYSLWRDEEDYAIAWHLSSDSIKRFIDAVGFPYKGASTTMDGRKMRILSAEAVDDVPIVNRSPGKLIFFQQGKPVIVCGKGLLRINEIIDDQTKSSLLPLQRLRVRFK
jgi:methionyl-tRNA formyltransferase